MKRTFFMLLFFVASFSLGLSLQGCYFKEGHAVRTSHNKPPAVRSNRYHHKRSYRRRARDPIVNTREERCIDSRGNRNGHVESWEKKNSGKKCR